MWVQLLSPQHALFLSVEDTVDRAAVCLSHSPTIFSLRETAPGHWELSVAGVPHLHLGELINEHGRAGLCTASPPVPLQLRRGKGEAWNECIIVHRQGPLHVQSASQCIFTADKNPTIIAFRQIVSATTDTSIPLEFARHPSHPSVLTLPPVGVAAHDFEEQHFGGPYLTNNVSLDPPLEPMTDSSLDPATSIKETPSPKNTVRDHVQECIQRTNATMFDTMDVYLFAFVLVLLCIGALFGDYCVGDDTTFLKDH